MNQDEKDLLLIAEWFQYHAPTLLRREKMETLRDDARAFAKSIIAIVPASADRTAMLRKLRELVMTGNQAIVLEGKV